ncbi:hypothetical protein F5884DRAFT_744175 [Xylogone sp. PMI_703]|nr:hypothetical protein F5884DRAFT_744175 [Xylogone sp. PMI_703]
MYQQQSYSQRELPPNYPTSTASTEKEALRVLEWQKDVARSVTSENEYEYTPSRSSPTVPTANKLYGSRPAPRRYDSTPLPQSQSFRLVHRETITSRTYEEGSNAEQERQAEKSKGISNTTIFGTLLGAAAGAAVAYAMVQSKEPEELDPALAYPLPQAQAQAIPAGKPRTVYTTQTKSTYVNPDENEYITSHEKDDKRRVDVIPARSYVSSRSRDEGHVPRILPAYPQATSIREGSTLVGEEDIDIDRDGRKSHTSGSSRRSRSETENSRYERPIPIQTKSVPRDDGDEESYVSSRRGSAYAHSQAPSFQAVRSQAPTQARSQAPSQYSRSQAPTQARSQAPTRSQSYSHTPSQAYSQAQSQAHTYVSANSRRSNSTIKPPTVKSMARDIDAVNDRRSSVSARQVPLPRSMVSGGYEDDVAYAKSEVSLAPSDSVSSVGLKMERERMRRMGY